MLHYVVQLKAGDRNLMNTCKNIALEKNKTFPVTDHTRGLQDIRRAF